MYPNNKWQISTMQKSQLLFHQPNILMGHSIKSQKDLCHQWEVINPSLRTALVLFNMS